MGSVRLRARTMHTIEWSGKQTSSHTPPIEPISVHSLEGGNPAAENSAKDWVPASAGTNGTKRRFKLISLCFRISCDELARLGSPRVDSGGAGNSDKERICALRSSKKTRAWGAA